MKRWPAFSLVEMAIVLVITGMLLTHIPALIKIHKTHQTKQQMDLAIKSLGAYVAKGSPLPLPAPPRTDEEFILKGTLPYEELGITRKGAPIKYNVDKALTDKSILTTDDNGLCNLNLQNRFGPDMSAKKDLVAFELSANGITETVTRNNFMAQYCGIVCALSTQAVTRSTDLFNVTNGPKAPL